MDRLASMAIFAKAVEAGSFSAAADALSTSSQVVGRHVRLLEDHLGVRLINRTTRRQSVTEPGRAFYDRVRTILAEVEAAETLAAESRAVPRSSASTSSCAHCAGRRPLPRRTTARRTATPSRTSPAARHAR